MTTPLGFSSKISEENLEELHRLWKDPWKIPTLAEIRKQEQLGQNFTNQSDATILAGIEVVTRFPGFHKFLVGTGEYGPPDYDIPGMCIFMDIPNYIQYCYESNNQDEINDLFEYILLKLIPHENDNSYNHLRFSFSDSTAFDNKIFREKFLTNLKDSELKNYLMRRFNATYENSLTL